MRTKKAEPAKQLIGRDLMMARMRNGGLLPGESPPPPDARPKPAKARDALAALATLSERPYSWGEDRDAGVMLDMIGELFRAELGKRVTPASASTVALNGRWAARDRADREGQATDVLSELGASRKEAHNWMRGADVPDADSSLRELARADAQGLSFLAACEFGTKTRKTITRKKLRAAYLAWCSGAGANPLSPADFRKAIELLPGVKSRTLHKTHELGWNGIGLRKRGTEV